MDVGQPQREIIVEPLQLPEPLRTEPQPEREPQREPQREPAYQPAQPEKEPAHV